MTVYSSLTVAFESFLKIEEDKTRSIEVILSPMLLEGDMFLILQVRDITERDIAKRLKELNEQKDSSLAAITHEFRSPLNGILSMLDALKPHVKIDL